MTFYEYLVECAVQKDLHPDWRMGQTYFNVLHEVSPTSANAIRATAVDPFYKDERIPKFLAALAGTWWEINAPTTANPA